MGQRWKPQQSTVYFNDKHMASQVIIECFSILSKTTCEGLDGI